MLVIRIFCTGFYHEHTRSDRDEYITVVWSNLTSGDTWLYEKCKKHGCTDLKVGYDYESVMHYGPHRHGKIVMIAKESGVTFGYRSKLSEKDVIGIQEHYGCGGNDMTLKILSAH